MKTRLFDGERELYTEQGMELDTQIRNSVEPIIHKYIELGVSLRDIQYIVQASVMDLVLEYIVGWQSNKVKNTPPLPVSPLAPNPEIEKSRASFEKHYGEINELTKRPSGEYVDWNLELTWKCWELSWETCKCSNNP
jgi:hypothetical protein